MLKQHRCSHKTANVFAGTERQQHSHHQNTGWCSHTASWDFCKNTICVSYDLRLTHDCPVYRSPKSGAHGVDSGLFLAERNARNRKGVWSFLEESTPEKNHHPSCSFSKRNYKIGGEYGFYSKLLGQKKRKDVHRQ